MAKKPADVKQLIKALVLAVAAGAAWYMFMSRSQMLQPPPPDKGAPAATQPADGAATTQPAATQPGMTKVRLISAAPAAKLLARPAPTTQPQELTIGGLVDAKAKTPHFRMQVQVEPKGAGIASIRLADYFATPANGDHYQIVAPGDPGAGIPTQMSVPAVIIDGARVTLDEIPWSVVSRSADNNGQSITLAIEVADQDNRRVLTVEKTYSLAIDSYVLGVSYRMLADRPIEASIENTGLVLGGQVLTSQDEPQAFWGVLAKGDRTPKVESRGRGDIIKDPGKTEFPLTTGDRRLSWAGVASRFFAVLLHPTAAPDKGRPATTQPADSATATRPTTIQPPLRFRFESLGNDDKQSSFQLAWTSEPARLAAGEDATIAFSNFVGPKDRDLLNSEPFVLLSYNRLLTYAACGCPEAVINPLIWLMVSLLNLLEALVGNYGVAIMILVAIVRIVLHPLTRKSQVSMAKMSKLQPKIEELKKQYGENKQELNRAMAEFYKQQGFSPVLGCLPMLLQMPIWIALWGALYSSIELRHAPFFWWINDLSAPDALIRFAEPWTVPLVGWKVHSFNLLPILLMIAMFFQQLLTPKPAGPQAGQQKFMMYFMTVFFGLFFYSMPSGLSLYVMASTAIGAVEQYFIKRHIQQQEALEGTGPVAVVSRPRPRPAGRPPRRKR